MSVHMSCGGEEADMRANRIETEKMAWEQKQVDRGRFAEHYCIDQFDTKEEMWVTLRSFIIDHSTAARDARMFEKQVRGLQAALKGHRDAITEYQQKIRYLEKRVEELEAQQEPWSSLA